MAVATIKFSQFLDGGTLNGSDLVVGLKSSVNSYFIPSGEGDYWSIVTSNTQMLSNHGYIVNSATPIILALPVTSVVGDEIAVSSLGTGGWTVSQITSQRITITNTTTPGVPGGISSTSATDSIRLVCNIQNIGWTTSGGPQGGILVT